MTIGRMESHGPASSFSATQATSLPLGTLTHTIVPGVFREESWASWFQRAVRTIGVAESASFIARSRPKLVETLIGLSGADAPRQQKALQDYRAIGSVWLFHSSSQASRLYCPKCAFKRFLEGKTPIREEIWDIPWSTFCLRDGTPLLEQPEEGLAEIIATQLYDPLETLILEAAKQSEHPAYTYDSYYLDWSPIWPRIRELEILWHGGESLDVLKAVTDTAAALCANFYSTPEYSAITALCKLPERPYGDRLTQPTSFGHVGLSEVISVHVRRTAMAVAYAMLETALASCRLPRILPRRKSLQVGLQLWLRMSRLAHPDMWRWLMNATYGWPKQCDFALCAMLKDLIPEAKDRWDALLISDGLLARHEKRFRCSGTIPWGLAPFYKVARSAWAASAFDTDTKGPQEGRCEPRVQK